MADWDSLRSLRVHANILTVVIIILAAVFFFTPGSSRKKSTAVIDKSSMYAKVKAIRGISIRDQPSIQSNVISTASNNEKLKIIDNNAAKDEIDGKSGNWYKVEYQGLTGYVWGNYLE